MPHWSDPLLTHLAEQSHDTATLTLTLDTVAALVGPSLPLGASSRGFWHARAPKAMGQRLRASGWWVAQLQRRSAAPTITFIRYERTPWATGYWDNRST